MDKKHLFIGLGFAALALFLTFRNVSIQDLAASLQRIDYLYLLPAVVLNYLVFLLRAYRWKFLILSLKETTAARLMGPVCVGFMGNLLPARAGEFIRAYLLAKKESLDFSASFATIFVERIFDMLFLLGFIVWLLLFKSDLFEGIDGFGGYTMMEVLQKLGWISLVMSVGIVAFSYALIHWNEKMMNLINLFLRPLPERFREKILRLIDSFASGLHVLKDFKSVASVVLLSAALWAMITLSNYPIFLAYGWGDLPFSSLVVLMVTICAFITVFPTPGFLGSFQIACVVAMHNIFHVAEAEAASFGMVTWAVSFGFLIFIGTFYILREGLSIKQLTHVQEEMNA